MYLEPEALSVMCVGATMRTYAALRKKAHDARAAGELDMLKERNEFVRVVLGELSLEKINYLLDLVEQGKTEILCCILDRLEEVRSIDERSFSRLIFLTFKHQRELYRL